MVAAGRLAGFKHFFVPVDDASEAAMIPEIEVYPVSNLAALHSHLTNGQQISPANPTEFSPETSYLFETDFSEIKGQDKVVTISRASGTLTFPADFMLIGAMNPCPCSSLSRQI